jgi:hypothetical protein
MNRIYQGRVTKVQTLKPGTNGKSPEDWEDLPDWESALPVLSKPLGYRSSVTGDSPKAQAHQLFQDAVNYSTTEPQT